VFGVNDGVGDGDCRGVLGHGDRRRGSVAIITVDVHNGVRLGGGSSSPSSHLLREGMRRNMGGESEQET